MVTPDFADFKKLAQHASLVPVSRTVPADLLTPLSAFLRVAARQPHAFLLESVEGGEKIGRFTFLGFRPYMIVRARGKKIVLERRRASGRAIRRTAAGNIFEVVRDLLAEHSPAEVPGLPPFTSGAVGYFAYDVVRQLETLPQRARQDLNVPDCQLMFFDRLLAFDHVRHQIHIIAAADVTRDGVRKSYERALRDTAIIEKKLAGPLPRPMKTARTGRPLQVRAVTSRRQFVASVNRIKKYISAGDIFQAVLSQRLDLEPGVPPLEIYRALRTINPSPYMYFLRMGETTVLGSSPEMLVKVKRRKLNYRPIAGTRPRAITEEEDLRLESELRANEKERAEHVMLVDLGRNDLGRVSEYGSVKVRDLMIVERYSHVMHLVSSLEATLRPEFTAMDAFAACFPAGTLSGAPKVRAMEIIEELEPVRRGVYGGAILYADFAGNLDSCIAIRTMVAQGKTAHIQAGAGIVADSDPASEYEESLNKARALLAAVEQCRRR